MNFSYDTSTFQWPFPDGPDPQCMDGPQWGDCTLVRRALHQDPQDRIGLSPSFVEGQRDSELRPEPLFSMGFGFSSIYDENCAALGLLNTQSVPIVQVPDPLTLMDLWGASDSTSWWPRPPTHYPMSDPAQAIVRSGRRQDPISVHSDSRNDWLSQTTMSPLCRRDSMAETNAAPGGQFAPGRLAKVRAIQRNTNIFSDGHDGDDFPIEPPFAAAIPAPTAGPYASPACLATSMDNQTSNKMMVISARGRTKTRDPTRERDDARPHICTKHRTAYRHHGDLVRHERITPGHTAYQGPVTCVCRREYSRRDGMYKHLKTKKCTGPPLSCV